MRHYFRTDRRNVPKYDARQSLLRLLQLHMHLQKAAALISYPSRGQRL